MERNVHGGSLGLASHLRDSAFASPFPRDLRRTRGKRAADVVGDILRQRRARVNRPAAEIERVNVAPQSRKAGLRQRDPAPSKPAQLLELGGMELDRRKPASERLIEPGLDTLVEDRVELAASQAPPSARV